MEWDIGITRYNGITVTLLKFFIAQDALIPSYPKLEDDSEHCYRRTELELLLWRHFDGAAGRAVCWLATGWLLGTPRCFGKWEQMKKIDVDLEKILKYLQHKTWLTRSCKLERQNEITWNCHQAGSTCRCSTRATQAEQPCKAHLPLR